MLVHLYVFLLVVCLLLSLARLGRHDWLHRLGKPAPQTFRCQACRSTFTARRHTPWYHLKTPSHQVAMVLPALAEGLDTSAAERVAGLPSDDHHHLAHSCRNAR
jgi:hypothetical protein